MRWPGRELVLQDFTLDGGWRTTTQVSIQSRSSARVSCIADASTGAGQSKVKVEELRVAPLNFGFA
ncbi:MAG: hypothetical protein DMG25_04975 [Acidobacteria bacterium]|nr:MAG: hypothetical protein DMG25_04975 [Acidobacteriota bacterium]